MAGDGTAGQVGHVLVSEFTSIDTTTEDQMHTPCKWWDPTPGTSCISSEFLIRPVTLTFTRLYACASSSSVNTHRKSSLTPEEIEKEEQAAAEKAVTKAGFQGEWTAPAPEFMGTQPEVADWSKGV
ncbi:hypothetical protein CB1_000142014 [Camelus ferus]|nr:hypothetical protein CB1_000142014 [Camelus ferus]